MSVVWRRWRVFLRHVFLTDDEKRWCDEVALRRELSSQAKHSLNNVREEQSLKIHQEGVDGERAAAKCLGIPCEGRVDNYRGADLGRYLEVKTCHITHGNAHLIVVCDHLVRDFDYLFMTGTRDKGYTLEGYLPGLVVECYGLADDEGVCTWYLENPQLVFWIPQKKLWQDFENLRDVREYGK